MKRNIILWVVLVAVAGGAIWWWQHDRGAPDAPPIATATKSVETAIPKVEAPKPRSGEVDVPQRVMIDDDPKGALRLEGQVVDADDHAVAGATVVLGSNPPRTTTSAPDGGFAFDALVGRPYALVARAPEGVAGPITARLTDKSPPVIMKLRPGSKLTVTVVGGDQKPVEIATVELRGYEDRRELAKKGVAVFANAMPGGYQVAAWSDGMAKTFQWVQLGAGDEEVRVTLAAGAKVTGRVVDEGGAAVAGARVRFSGASDWSQQGGDRQDAAVSDADGKFEFAALPAGSFRFVASHPERAPGTSALVTLDGKTQRDNVSITMAQAAIVRGHVVDAAKQPVASARVRIGATMNPRAMIFESPRQAYTDAQGAFEIRGLPRKPLAAVALHESGASQTVPVDTTAGDQKDVTLLLDVTGTIAGIVVDPAGQPMEGVQVSAGPTFGDNRTQVDFSQWRLRGFPEELTDAGGKFTLTGLTPGSYTVSAAPARSSSRARRSFGGGGANDVTAKTGDTSLRIVLPPEGAVKGKIAFGDGATPTAFTVGVGMSQQAFSGNGEFLLDSLAPQKYELVVRGPSFQTRAVEITVESGKTADAGTITVVKGRTIGGTVLADGQPVAGATVHIGRLVFGNGSTSNANFGPMGAGTKHDTTDAAGQFILSGFPDGDITIVAEHDTLGRSRAVRLPTVMPGQTELTLTLEKFGSLSGILRQGDKPAEGVFVSCQSTTTPGAIYSVASGPDGSYRFDRLAPDVYKVSATLGMPMVGMKFYSKQIEVPAGKSVTVDLAVEPGAITIDLTVVPRAGRLGVANVYIATGAITARSQSELSLKMAAAGPGASQWVIIRNGEPARFAEVVPGSYSACVVPYPAEVRGMSAMGYGERHGDSLPAFCKPFTVAASPATQSVQVPVDLPPFIAEPGSGSGSGTGSGSGSGS